MALSVSSNAGSLPDPRALDYDSVYYPSGLTITSRASDIANRNWFLYEWTPEANGWAAFRGTVYSADSEPLYHYVDLLVKDSGGDYRRLERQFVPSYSFPVQAQLTAYVLAGRTYRFTYYGVATNLTNPTNTMTNPQIMFFPYLVE